MITPYNWKNKSDSTIVKLVMENQASMEEERTFFEPLWNKINQVFRPRRCSLLHNSRYTHDEQFGAKVYDQGPANSLNKFVAGKIGYMVNRSVPWIQFTTPDTSLMQLDHIKQYTQDLAEQCLYAVSRSNFYSAIVPSELDVESSGTTVMVPMLDEVKDRVVFDVVHPDDSYIMVDKYGDPCVYHRKTRLSRLSALEMFGKDKLPAKWFNKGELKTLTTKDEYIWCVYPNEDRDSSSKLSVDKKFFTMCILISSTGRDKKGSIMYKSGRDYFPVCHRSMRESGSSYGISIAADCLTSGLVANKLTEKAVLAAHVAVDPAKIASSTLRNSLRTRPGSVSYVDDIQREGVKAVMDRLNWPITDAQIARIQAQVDDRMFIKFFEMLSAGDIKSRTAYEVSQMMAEKATLMSTIIDTFEQEVLEPAIEIILREEFEAGRLPEPPDEIAETGGSLNIVYLGPLSQMQRSLLRSRGTIDSLAILQQMMNMSQEVGWVFNWRQMAEDVTVAQGMPQKFILSDGEQQKKIDSAAQSAQSMQDLEMLKVAGSAANGLNKDVGDNSITKKLMQTA